MTLEHDQPTDRGNAHLADGRVLMTRDLAPVVYEDLRRVADGMFRREQRGITLQPTALVHGAYLALADQENQTWESRANFLAVAATAMRRVLINAAKARRSGKRGGGWQRVTLHGGEIEGPSGHVDLLDLDAALTKLAGVKKRYVRILEMRYFGGMTLDEVASTLGVGRTLVVREWALAKAWLATELAEMPNRGL